MKVFITKKHLKAICLMFAIVVFNQTVSAQSIAHQWNEVQLSCIRKDRARPTVQARNLSHAAIVMWDAWAVYDDNAQTVLLGNTLNGFSAAFNGVPIPADVQAAREKAISYAMYRYLTHRYLTAPVNVPAANVSAVQGYLNSKMTALGFSTSVTSTDYSDGDPAKLGNYIAQQMQLYGLQDGSNQGANYADQYYTPVNGQLQPQLMGNPNCYDPNRWQPMCLTLTCDQGTGPGFPEPCLVIPCNAPALTHEFGNVKPFALTEAQKTVHTRDGNNWNVYLDPGAPPMLDMDTQTGMEDPYKWGYVMNTIWHSMHTTEDNVTIDISPASVGNVLSYPTNFTEYQTFYDLMNGGDSGEGYDVNPATGLPYETQIVPRGDYTRALSEYWADGPASETPPGHWFKILNDVNEHPLQQNLWNGQGELLSDLEWDVRSYLAMGGAILDAAIACWGAKGYYDYTRPIFAIRAMCDLGQSSDENLPNYHPAGIPLVPGYIELIEVGDPLAGDNDEYVGEIKLYTWLGPAPSTGEDGVGWKRGSEWWTYQVATFVTPPFAGFYSGHSTYSRAGAEVMSLITGDEYFPGGMSEYVINPGSLYADSGPTVPVHLQWAKYRDASDQCSLSRIFGGLHPPQDDIPGRMNGAIIGPQAFTKAETFMYASVPHVASISASDNLITDADAGNSFSVTVMFTEEMDQTVDPTVSFNFDNPTTLTLSNADGMWISADTYVITYLVNDWEEELNNVVWKISGAMDLDNETILPALSSVVKIDTRNPLVNSFESTGTMFNAASAGIDQLSVTFMFDEAMDTNSTPTFAFSESLSSSVVFNSGVWNDYMTYTAMFDIVDNNDQFQMVSVMIESATDEAGNAQQMSTNENVFSIDTREPAGTADVSVTDLNQASAGADALTITINYDETMDNSVMPSIDFPSEDAIAAGLQMTFGMWNVDNTSFIAMYDLADLDAELMNIDVVTSSAKDLAGNTQFLNSFVDIYNIDTKQPLVSAINTTDDLITDGNLGTGTWAVSFTFDEDMDTSIEPIVSFPGENPATTLLLNGGASAWDNPTTYTAVFNVLDAGVELENIDVAIDGAQDALGNPQFSSSEQNSFDIDTRNPQVILFNANDLEITDENIGTATFSFVAIFDEEMDVNSIPAISFPVENPLSVLTYNAGASSWLNNTTFLAKYDVADVNMTLMNVDVTCAGLQDLAGNPQVVLANPNYIDIEVGVGVAELGDNVVTVYPNPAMAGQNIIVAMSQIPADLSIQMYDLSGKLIEAYTQKSLAGNQIQIQTSNLASGMYFIKLISADGNATMKVQVSK